jgi:hypothetical protein
MTPEQQQSAIEKACGWWISESLSIWQHETKDGAPPNYLNDLNAMHEAEKVLKGGMRSKYDAELTLICSRDYNFIWESTASQRAEAFLRTIGKWEESK